MGERSSARSTSGGDPIYLFCETADRRGARGAAQPFEPRRRLRAMAAELGAWEPLAMLLAGRGSAADGAGRSRTSRRRSIEEARRLLREPRSAERHDRGAMEPIRGAALAPGHRRRITSGSRGCSGAAGSGRRRRRRTSRRSPISRTGGRSGVQGAARGGADLSRSRARSRRQPTTYRRDRVAGGRTISTWRALDELYGELKTGCGPTSRSCARSSRAAPTTRSTRRR